MSTSSQPGAPSAVAPISVVVCTRNRAVRLTRCLADLQAQAPGVQEIVVVDDASTDHTGAVAEGAGCRLLRLRDRHGIPAARNAGARVAEGDVLSFIDDDTEVLPGWAAGLQRAFAAGAQIVAGEILSPPPRTLAERYLTGRAEHDVGGRNGFLPAAGGANVAVRRSLFEELGGFDGSLPGAEDLDLSFRAQLRGHPLTFAPAAAVVHMRRARVRGMLRQQARNAHHRRLLDRKYDNFPFQRMTRGRGRIASALTTSAVAQALALVPADRRHPVAPLLDASMVAARRVGMRLADLELLVGVRGAPEALGFANAAQRNLATDLSCGPALLLLGDDALAVRLTGMALEGAGLAVAPPGVERMALERWSDAAPWSPRLVRLAVAAGWAVPGDLLALRVERERPRTWGEAFLTLHAAYAWLRGSARFAIAATGPLGHQLADRLPAVPVVAAGSGCSGDRAILAIGRRGLLGRTTFARVADVVNRLPDLPVTA